MLIFTGLYFVTAIACGAVPSWPGWAIYHWLPGGVLLGWLLSHPLRTWPAWIAGAAMATFAFGLLRAEIHASRQLVFFIANLAGAMTGAFVAKKWIPHSNRLESPEDFGRLLLVIAVSGVPTALIVPLGMAGGYGAEHMDRIMLSWFINAQTGGWLLTPLVLLWQARPTRSARGTRRLERVLLLGALSLTLLWLAPMIEASWPVESRYLTLPVICWAALRLGRTCTAITILIATLSQSVARHGDVGLPAHELFMARLHAFLDAGLLAVFGFGLALALYAQRRSRREVDRLASVVQKTGAAVVLTNPRGVLTWINDGFITLTGYPREEALGRRPGELLRCPESDAATVARISEGVRAGRSFSETLINRRRDGSLYWNHIDVEPLHRPDGTLEGFIGVQLDVSRLREAESLRAFVRHAPVALAMIDRAGLILAASESWGRLLAPDAGPLSGRHLASVVHSPPAGWSRLGEAAGRGADTEAWTRADGGRLMLRWEARPWRDEAGQPGGVIVFAEDISARLRSENALRAEAERFDLLTRATHELIWDWDVRTGAQWWNAAYHAFFGTDPTTFRPTYDWWLEQLHPEDKPGLLARFDAFAASTDTCFSAEFRLRAGDGQYVPLATRTYCVRDASGAIMRLIGANADLSAKREAEEAHLIRGKLEATGTLAAGIAHDFNNLSTALMLNLDLALIKGRDDPETAAGFIRAGQDAVMTSRALTERLLTFAEGGTAVRTAIEPARLLRRAIEPVLADTRIDLRLHVAPDIPWMEGEEHQLEQAFRNLAANACDAMPSGGRLTVTVERVTMTEAAPGGPAAGDYVRVLIMDDGPGVPADIAARIFDPYFSTKPRGPRKGQGLGLTICQSVLRRHGGLVRLARNSGSGAVFEVLVPATTRQPDIGKSRLSPTSAAPGRRPLRVLVMDDEPALRSSIGALLTLHGEECVLAADGDEAVAHYTAARAAGRPFDVVVLDLIVHGGKGGVPTLTELRTIDPDVAAIAISGYAHADAMRRHESHGFRAAAAKPFTAAELLRVVRATARSER